MFWNYLIILLSFVVLTGCVQPSENDAVAKQLYIDAAYDKATSEWRRLCEEGVTDPDVFYNLGIAASQEGNIPLAVINLEKAIRYNPGNRNYTTTLEEIRGRISNAVIPVETFFLSDWWRKGISIVRPGIWALIGLLLLVAGMVRFLQFNKLIKFRMMVIPGHAMIYAAGGLILLLISFFSYHQIHRLNEGVVFTVCEMKEGPSDQSPFIREVAAGEKISVLDAIPGWTKVNLLNMDEGWVKNECYRIIDPKECK